MNKRGFTLFFYVLMLFVLLFGCAPRIEKPTALKPSTAVITGLPSEALTDDLDVQSLNKAIDASIRYYEKVGNREPYCIHKQCYQAQEMITALQEFRVIMNDSGSITEKAIRIRNIFDFYQAAGRDGQGTVIITGYFEPILDGSLIKTEKFRYPLYRTPEDTVLIRLGLFNPKYGTDRLVGRLKGNDVVPHYSRKDIDIGRQLEGKGLEIAWVDDPVALFILHIQGSGQIRLPDGTMLRVNYAQSNGKPFRGLTAYMVAKGFLTEAEKGYQQMKTYLQDHPETRNDIMNYNESYVFFRIVDEGPIGSLGFPVVAGRSIATDPAVFPKGALVFITSRKPVFKSEGRIHAWVSYSRFVMNHDAGGAIKGSGRMDLFCGTGLTAERLAGSLNEKGNMYFLVPRRL
jgi:membrane-bound lytic murein transglycosylase A